MIESRHVVECPEKATSLRHRIVFQSEGEISDTVGGGAKSFGLARSPLQRI